MTYYLTQTSPLVFTTQKAEKVTESMIMDMLELLLKREYEMYSPEEAVANITYWTGMDGAFNYLSRPPMPKDEEDEDWMPTDKQIRNWCQELLFETEYAGPSLLNQIGEPLHKQILDEDSEEDESFLTDETTLSDLLEGLTYPAEGDHAGPELHSRTMGYDVD